MYRVQITYFLAALVFSLSAIPSQAFFVNEEADALPPKPSFELSGVHNAVTQLGVGAPGSVAGFGENLPMTDSLDMILPAGWKYSPAEEVEMDHLTATWKSEGTWVEVLEDLGAKNNLRFLVDWSQRQVLVTKADPSQPVTVTRTQYSEAAGQEEIVPAVADNQIVSSVMQNEGAGEDATENAEKLKTWVLEPGSMKVQLAKWAATEGWQLVWSPTYDRKDLVSTVRAEFQAATFLDAAQIVVEHLSQGEGIRLRSHAYKANQVLLIKGE